jgi:RNA polymerase subunit RPABC4/transcription elongation factor Spt4
MASRFCTKCGSATIEGQRFCKVCGQPLAQAAPPTEPESVFRPALEPHAGIPSPGYETGEALAVKTCSKCGTVLTPDQRSCWVCGQPVAGVSEPGAPPISPSVASPTWSEVSAPASAPAPAPLGACTKCGAVLTADQRSCWVCGTPVGAISEAPLPVPEPYQPAGPEPGSNANSFTRMWAEVTPAPAEPASVAPDSNSWSTPEPVVPSLQPWSTSEPYPDPGATQVWKIPSTSPATPEPAASTSSSWSTPTPDPYPDPGATQVWTIPSSISATPLPEPVSHEPVSELEPYQAAATSSSLAASAFSAPSSWPESAPPAPAAPEPSPAPEAVCTGCHAALVPGQKFCRICGTPAVAAAPPVAAPEAYEPSAPSSQTWPADSVVPAAAPLAPPPPVIADPELAPAPEAVCAGCHAALIPGQKFCRICGTPSEAAAPPTPVAATEVYEPAAPPTQAWPAESVVPASVPLAPPPPPILADLPIAAPEPAIPVIAAPTEPIRCPTCRTVLSAGQRTCWVCGQVLGPIKQPETLAEMGAPTHTYVEVAVAIPEATGTKPEIKSSAVPPIPPSIVPVVPAAFPPPQSYTPVVPSAPPPAFPPIPASNYPPYSSTPPPSVPPMPGPAYAATMPPIKDQRNYFDSTPSAAPVATGPVVKKSSNAGLWIVLFVLILGAGGAGAWYFLSYKPNHNTNSVTASAPTDAAGAVSVTPVTPPSTPAPSADHATAPATSAVAPLDQPADTPSTAPAQAAPVSPPPPVPGSTPPTHHAAPAPVPSSAHVKPPPEPGPVPPLDPLPTQPTSGTLRYSGPPVAQNGVVVFDHLPGARMRFTFDRDSWQPIISHNSDGTQKLTLRSTRPGTQSDCIVQWQTVQ